MDKKDNQKLIDELDIALESYECSSQIASIRKQQKDKIKQPVKEKDNKDNKENKK